MQGSKLSPNTRNIKETTPMHTITELLKTSKERKSLKGKKLEKTNMAEEQDKNGNRFLVRNNAMQPEDSGVTSLNYWGGLSTQNPIIRKSIYFQNKGHLKAFFSDIKKSEQVHHR